MFQVERFDSGPKTTNASRNHPEAVGAAWLRRTSVDQFPDDLRLSVTHSRFEKSLASWVLGFFLLRAKPRTAGNELAIRGVTVLAFPFATPVSVPTCGI